MSKDGNPDYNTLKGARLAMWRHLHSQLENIDWDIRNTHMTEKQIQNYERIMQEFDERLFKKAGWVWVQTDHRAGDWEAKSKEWLEANKASVVAVLHGNIQGWRFR